MKSGPQFNLLGTRVLVLGLGESGYAAARWCSRQGASVMVADTRHNPPFKDALAINVPKAQVTCGALSRELLSDIDLVVLSPGLSPELDIVAQANRSGISVVGEIDLFASAIRDIDEGSSRPKRTRILAITGTNGKTTTATLAAHLIQSTGVSVSLAGNISPAALSVLMARLDDNQLPDVWVLELSSFQLETLQTLNADAATVLNISGDHLDRHGSLENYARIKARVFAGEGAQIINRQDDRIRRMAISGRRIIRFGLDAPTGETDFGLRDCGNEPWIVRGDEFLLPLNELRVAGRHNATNAMAAMAFCTAIDIPRSSLVPALRLFRGLPHRLQVIADIGGIRYVNDSKATNVGATVAAVEAGLIDLGKLILILGGDGKNQDFSPLRAAVAGNARAVVLMGRDGPHIAKILNGCGVPMLIARDMVDAVRLATLEAQTGDVVLLSPACASFDMFRNYEHRGDAFAAAVSELMHSR